VPVSPGSTYVIELTEATTMFGWYLYTEGDVYLNGRAIVGGDFYDELDFTFRTYAPSGPPVGGFIESVNKLTLAVPYLALFGVVATVAVVVAAPWKKFWN
ncbi:hypothetical protein, partial [[Eubacterium] cellulosolvens]